MAPLKNERVTSAAADLDRDQARAILARADRAVRTLRTETRNLAAVVSGEPVRKQTAAIEAFLRKGRR